MNPTKYGFSRLPTMKKSAQKTVTRAAAGHKRSDFVASAGSCALAASEGFTIVSADMFSLQLTRQIYPETTYELRQMTSCTDNPMSLAQSSLRGPLEAARE